MNRVEPNLSFRLICSSQLKQNLSKLKFGCLIWVSHHSPKVDLPILGLLITSGRFDLYYVLLDRFLHSLHDGANLWMNRRSLMVPKINSFWGMSCDNARGESKTTIWQCSSPFTTSSHQKSCVLLGRGSIRSMECLYQWLQPLNVTCTEHIICQCRSRDISYSFSVASKPDKTRNIAVWEQ